MYRPDRHARSDHPHSDWNWGGHRKQSPATPSPAATPATPQKITYTACNVDGPYIAMTYDDGPHAVLTPRLLDMLKERNIKATFYMVGQNVVAYPQIVKRMVAEGHEVASHSWSHPLLSKMSDAGVKEQLSKTHEAIKNAAGVRPQCALRMVDSPSVNAGGAPVSMVTR